MGDGAVNGGGDPAPAPDGKGVAMVSRPLDLEALLAEAAD